jgi:3-deoxy-D-manno-octulosonic-acid transferase
MMGILLDIAYGFALVVCWPIWLYRMVKHGRYRTDWHERFGEAPISYGLQPTIWIHGVSLGEVNAARTLVQEIHSQLPQYRVVISSTTETGMAAAERLYAPDHTVFRWPLDFTWAVRRAIKRVRPNLVVLMEGEAWPNFLHECNTRDIPAVIVNGRISPDKGYPRYRKLGKLASRLFNRLAAIGVQDERYAEMFLDLGVDACKLHLTGMMKFDTIDLDTELPGQEKLAAALGLSERPLWVAGGTGPGEEEQILAAYKQLRKSHAQLALAIVPRKPERFDEVATLIGSSGFACIRRSERPDGTEGSLPDGAVILGDTMGELRTFYALADVAFVGRSLVPMGGSDMIEVAALGKPTCYGPHTFNFPQADDLLMHGCRRVKGPSDLTETIDTWLTDAGAAAKAGREARQYVRSQQGATQRNVELICHVLDLVPAHGPGQIATPAVHAVS